MVIAYLRISTGKQHIANQQDEIMRFALSKDLEIHKWVTEVVSGKKAKKERKLGKTLRRLKQGDILIVTELSRLSRTLTEIMSIVGECLERKITIYSTKDGYAFDDSINRKQSSKPVISFSVFPRKYPQCGSPGIFPSAEREHIHAVTVQGLLLFQP